MKFVCILCNLFFIYYCHDNKSNFKSSNEKTKIYNSIVEIHLSRTNGMIDMTKNITNKYYSLNRYKIYSIEELSKPNGEIMRIDTINIIQKDNSKIFKDLEMENSLVPFFSEGLQDDSNSWAFTVYYSNKKIKEFTFTTSDDVPKYAIKLYNLLDQLEKN